MEEFILVFRSTNHAVALYKKLKDIGMKVEIISTPCRISLGCSKSIKVYDESKIGEIENIAKANKIKMKRFFKVSKRKRTGRKSYELIKKY
ncbi:DUF3343 domain-containing protein [Haloimpatiens sp. FM7330]|uniref:DUF3343 domain-containing protein n=1 Tax=Haloimpatiens sp. FM7330 TaxID=3298610 RepID=UPI0036276B8D